MKLSILVPSADYKGNAGARIRYGRVSQALAENGILLSLENISEFDPRTADCDVLVVSKCHDARSLVAAEAISRRGKAVGVDLFDNYFDQRADSRLNRYRLWLQQILDLCNFAICSTPAMAELIADYSQVLPVHVLNDPAPQLDHASLSTLLAKKISEARSTGQIRLCWFGIGDNPSFPVGLSDIAAFKNEIARLSAGGIAVELTILTNARSLSASRLAMLADLPLVPHVEEWSEAGEAQLLREATVCFLPVNAQSFSAAKSLNRATTALSSGCQVLAAGYPLYAPLDPFLYRDPAAFLCDFRNGDMRLSPATINEYRVMIESIASPQREALELAEFIANIDVAGGEAPELGDPLFLVHGFATNGAAHKMVQTLGGLTVASPFCEASYNFDVIFRARSAHELAMLVSDKSLARLLPEVRAEAVANQRIGTRNFWEVPNAYSRSLRRGAWTSPSLPLQLALYPSTMEKISEILVTSFGGGRIITSETAHLPFEIAYGMQ